MESNLSAEENLPIKARFFVSEDEKKDTNFSPLIKKKFFRSSLSISIISKINLLPSLTEENLLLREASRPCSSISINCRDEDFFKYKVLLMTKVVLVIEL